MYESPDFVESHPDVGKGATLGWGTRLNVWFTAHANIFGPGFPIILECDRNARRTA